MATLLVGLLVLAVIVLALRATIRQSKSGGCAGCSGCGEGCACHQTHDTDQKT
ncbi:MAG: FeoB-associated Cys-rich membrane protein [Eubacteriales bacterium]|nr:FeoB-associated Cys-rich membrane protein [Eubacteriales bacterium]